MTDPNPAEAARIVYRVGDEYDGDGYGRYELTLSVDGTAALSHWFRGVHHRWTARADAVVWPRLVDALRRGRFPQPPPATGRRGVLRRLVVTGVDPAGELWLSRGTGTAAGLTDALRLLDSVAHQVSGGELPGVGTLPRIVSRIVAGPGTEPEPAEVAVAGMLGQRAVVGVVRLDGRVDVLDPVAATTVAALAPTGSPPRSVAFGDVGPSGEPRPVIVTGGDDGLIRMWSPDGAPLTRQVRHVGPVTAVTTTIGADRLRVWTGDLAGGLLERTLEPGPPVRGWPVSAVGITALAWVGAPGYQMLVVGSDDGRIGRRSLADPADTAVWPSHDGPVNAVSVVGVDDDFLIASAGADRVIRLRTGRGGEPWPDLSGHDATVTGLAFGLVGERLVLGSCALDGTVSTWDVESRQRIAHWPAGDDWPAALADARTDGVQRWATGGADGVVRIWDAASGERVAELVPGDGAAAVLCVATALLPGLTLVAAGHQDGSVRVWNAGNGTLVGVDRSSTDPVTSVEFGSDGSTHAFVCGTLAGSVRAYDPSTGALVLGLGPHTDQVLSVALGRARPGDDEPVIVSGGADRSVRVWAARSGWPLAELAGHTDLVTAVAVAESDGRSVVVSGGFDRTVRRWELTGAQVWSSRGPASTVYAVAVGGGLVVTGGLNDAVRGFVLADGTESLVTDPVTGLVSSVATGVWRGVAVVVAAGADVGVRCWILPAGHPAPVVQPPWPVLAVTLTPAGELWAIGSDGVTVVEPSPVSSG